MIQRERKKALVLSGGGGRGAYHVGALRFLEEHEWFPDVVVGTSIGAVNGAAIASGHSAYSLWALWRRLRTRNVQKANLNPLKSYNILDTSPLRDTLQREGWINFERINSAEAAVHLRITALEMDSGHLHVFGNSPDLYPSRLEQAPITVDHIIASCSIPVVYPATDLDGVMYWDGGTVANTPLGPAIDAGAEEIVVVMMTPWDESGQTTMEWSEPRRPRNLLAAAGAAFEWALLASFQADMKMFRYVNELVRLQVEVSRLRATLAEILARREASGDLSAYLVDKNEDGIPDILQAGHHRLPDPVIVAPQRPIPVEQIVSYTLKGHEEVYRMGYEDARRAWRASGREVEGEEQP